MTRCAVTFTPIEDLKAPKIYYQIENFYANHRNFVKSRTYKQLRGNVLGTSSLKTCEPIIRMENIGVYKAIDGSNLTEKDIAWPCGLIAKYFFNDTYKLAETATGAIVPIDETNIAHPVDKNNKFKLPGNKSVAWLDVTDEHVMVWY